MKDIIDKFVVENSHNRIIKMPFINYVSYYILFYLFFVIINCVNEYIRQIEHLFWLEYEGEFKLEAELESMTYEPNKVTAEYSLKAKYNGKYESEFILILNNADDEYMSYKTNAIIK